MDKSLIPEGLYCYTPISKEKREDGAYINKVKMCPFYEWGEDEFGETIGICLYMKIEDDICLNDQCKICDINNEFPLTNPE